MTSQAAPTAVPTASPCWRRATECPRCHGGGLERIWMSAGYERIVPCTGPAHMRDEAPASETRVAQLEPVKRGRGKERRR